MQFFAFKPKMQISATFSSELYKVHNVDCVIVDFRDSNHVVAIRIDTGDIIEGGASCFKVDTDKLRYYLMRHQDVTDAQLTGISRQAVFGPR